YHPVSGPSPPTAPQPRVPDPAGGRRSPEPPRPAARNLGPTVSVYRDTDDIDEAGDGTSPSGEPLPTGEASSADAYGPDDPAYGPPGPTWYERRKRERERELEEEEFLADAAEEAPPSRGVFEPPSHRPGSGGAAPTGLDLLLDAVDGSNDDGTDPLDRVKDLYLAAEAVSDEDLDRRFEELLERQRKLIGAFLERERPPIPDETWLDESEGKRLSASASEESA
ncbi:MAG: hypothetical protein J2P25_18825, partial [Nocardiopsaceae bacterium]|nr:hypothetical protein [Nocardiopsaceae bacterium]